ncbi:MAG: hypothetical protein WDO70_12225 [Alphaproteobacteria bacterium]
MTPYFKTALFLMTLLFTAPVHAGDATAGPWTSCTDKAAGQTQSNPDGFFACTTTGGTRKWAPQTIVIGETPATCNQDNTGRLGWNNEYSTLLMCQNGSWKWIIPAGAQQSIPPEGVGYFVLSHDTWNGEMGGISGANAKCLADLTANDWLGKSDADSREMLNVDHIKAFLCDGDGCAMALPLATYAFARSGSATAGGATFTANIEGMGPGSNETWAGVNYFGMAAPYWTGRQHPGPFETYYTSEVWFEWFNWNAGFSHCRNWTVDWDSGTDGNWGNSTATNESRWNVGGANCTTLKHLICFVHPG